MENNDFDTDGPSVRDFLTKKLEDEELKLVVLFLHT